MEAAEAPPAPAGPGAAADTWAGAMDVWAVVWVVAEAKVVVGAMLAQVGGRRTAAWAEWWGMGEGEQLKWGTQQQQ